MTNEMKPSEVMQNFLDYMKSCQREYQICMVEVHKHDKRVQDFYMVWNLPRIGRSGTGSQLRSVRAGKSVEGLKTVCSFWKDVQDYSVISPISSFLTGCRG